MTTDFGQLSCLTKVDLHIHTKESAYKDGELVKDGDIEHLPILLEALNSHGVNLFAFADHNRFNPEYINCVLAILNSPEGSKNYPQIRNVLSAVEFDVTISEGKPSCHVLTIFDAKDASERARIQNEIEKRKLVDQNEAYDISTFAKLLSGICLPTILIACQRKDIHNPKGKSNSISDSCDDVDAFLKTGYISALEYQKPNVEGILQNCLKDFPESVRPCLLANSDCHEWSHYPQHDRNALREDEKSWCFQMFAQPSFLGLLMTVTSPSTRLKRFPVSMAFLNSFTFNGETHQLSPGFNAIIGENGSGKSSLLSLLSNPQTKKEKHIQKIQKDYAISINRGEPEPIIHYIKQAELVERSYSDEKNNNLFGQDAAFPELNHELFEKEVRSFADSIKRSIKNKITWKTSERNLKSQSFEIIPELDASPTYYVSVLCDSSFSTTENPFRKRIEALNAILDRIALEFRQREYTQNQRETFLSAYAAISTIRSQIAQFFEQTEYINNIKSEIVSCVNHYKSVIKERLTTRDTEVENYRRRRTDFVDAVLKVIENKNKYQASEISSISTKFESCRNTKNGFDFICTPQYACTYNLETEVLKYIFNSQYQTIAEIKTIESESDFSKAVTRSEGDGTKRFDDLVASFIGKFEATNKTILIHDTNGSAGGTMGEQALSYYRYITSIESEYQTILIDQPEDNISVPAILRKMIKYFNDLRDRKQIIFVTHNPLLVINMDVDNVIYLNKENGTISCVSGCLEKKGILEKVEECLDGGKEALKRRLNVYE